MSIEVNLHQFDPAGNLTAAGKESFWKEINRGFKKFDKNEIFLRPRFPIQNTGRTEPKHGEKREKLPTPPKQRKSSTAARHFSSKFNHGGKRGHNGY